MASKHPVTDAERARILALHEQGLGRNDICREVGRSAAVVTATVHAAGGSFDRAATRAATEARKADCAQLRADLELDLLQDAKRLRAQLWQPMEYIDHGGRDFFEQRWTVAEPTPTDKLKIMQATGIAVDRSLKIAALSSGGDLDLAKSMLGQLMQQLRVAVATDPDDAEARDAAPAG